MYAKNWALCLLLLSTGYEYSMEKKYEIIYRGVERLPNGQLYDVYDEVERYIPIGIRRRNKGRLSHCLNTFNKNFQENIKFNAGALAAITGGVCLGVSVHSYMQMPQGQLLDTQERKSLIKYAVGGGLFLLGGSYVFVEESVKMMRECCRSLDDVE